MRFQPLGYGATIAGSKVTIAAVAILAGCATERSPSGPQVDPVALASVSLVEIESENAEYVSFDLRVGYSDRAELSIPRVDGLGFSVVYDTSIYTLIGVTTSSGLLNWEYFTYRIHAVDCLRCPGTGGVTAIAIKKMTDSPLPVQLRPSGNVLRLDFILESNDGSPTSQRPISFVSHAVDANFLLDETRDAVFLPTVTSPGLARTVDYDSAQCGSYGWDCSEAVDYSVELLDHK